MLRNRRLVALLTLAWAACVLSVAFGSGQAWSATPNSATAARSAAVQETTEMQGIDLFQAMQAGALDVKLIPKDSTQSTVIIENKSKKPVKIRLPEAFAGVPVLAQDFGNDRGGGGRNGGNNNNSNQSMGGGMGGMGMGGGMRGGMGGMFNVAPGKVHKVKVPTVCLEHGKRDPNPRIEYALKPIESFTKDAKVIELCKMLGRGEIKQHTAQAAAWHLTDGLSWQELLAKIKVRHLNGATERYFSQNDVHGAMMVVQETGRRTADDEASKSPSGVESAAYYGENGSEID